MVHFSIQRNHLHFVVEASDRKTLSVAICGLLGRLAGLGAVGHFDKAKAAGPASIAVGRYAPGPEGRTAEFALTVADDWQAKGLGRALLARLCDTARAAGYEALYGHVLSDNLEMLELAARMGFEAVARDGNETTVVRRLR